METMPDLSRLSRQELAELTAILEEQEKRKRQGKFFEVFPAETKYGADGEVATLWDGTPLYARSLYPKHLEFFRAGADYRERGAVCGNRIGKTFMGAFETSAHLTGLYPDWWEGKRFKRPVRWWAAGKTNETTRDIVQGYLIGEVEGGGSTKRVSGTGMIPGRLLDQPKWKAGVADLLDTIRVKHVTGGWSTLGLKSYQQGRGSFEGTAQHGIWLDEEPPLDVYTECLTRTATTNGIILLTVTPLEGMSEVIQQFYDEDT